MMFYIGNNEPSIKKHVTGALRNKCSCVSLFIALTLTTSPFLIRSFL